MVGVAGKSKGCNTCRKRRVKCDRDGVPCGQCRKGGRTCAGYTRDRYFKNLSSLDHDSLLSRSQPLIPLTEPSVITYEPEDIIPKQQHLPNTEASSRASSHTESAHNEVNPIKPITFNQLFAHFMEDYMPTKSGVPSAGSDPPVSWMQIIPDIPGQHASLDQAVTALTMVRLGRKLQDDELKKEGMTLYGQALGGIQIMLSSDSLLYQEHTLASVMTLSIFEVLETSDENVTGWISHVQGLSSLFQLRGPGLHIKDSSHKLFLGFRPTAIIYSLATRKSTYFGDPDWLNIPWMYVAKSDFHHLLDIMAQLPSLLEKTQAFLSPPTLAKDPEYLKSLLKEAYSFKLSLQEWHLKLISKSATPAYTGRSTPTYDSYFEILHPTSFHFEEFELARMHLFYWAALLLIYNEIQSLYAPNPTSTSLHSNSHQLLNNQTITIDENVPYRIRDPQCKLDMQKEQFEIATLITKTIPYLLSEEAHTLGPQNTFFPLHIAMHTFSQLPGKESEESWCRAIFGVLDRRGYRFGKILSGVEWDDIPGFLAGGKIQK